MDIRGFEFYAADGTPATGLTVQVYESVLGTPVGSALASTTTDSNGMWAFAGLTDTPKDVKVSLGGRFRWYKGATRHSMNRLLLSEGLIAPGVSVSHLVNGGFEYWDKGAGAFTTDGVHFCPGWSLGLIGGSSASVVRNSSEAHGYSQYCCSVTYTQVGGLASYIFQRIPDLNGGSTPYSSRNRYITFACDVYSTVPNAVVLGIGDGVDTFAGSGHTGSGWERLSVTALVNASASVVLLSVNFSASGTYYLDNAVLSYGQVAQPYIPYPADQERYRSMTRMEKQGGVDASFPRLMGYLNSGSDDWIEGFPWLAYKHAVPTVTVAGSWLMTNCAGTVPTVDAVGRDGYSMHVTSSGSGLLKCRPGGANDYLVAECVV